MSAPRFSARIALRSLAQRKGRTALTMAGVATGIVTLTLVTALTRGTQLKVERGIQAFGPDAVMVAAGSPQTRGPGDERVTTLVPEDLDAIRSEVGGLRVIVPIVSRTGQTAVAGDRNTTVTVFASTPDFEEAWDWHPESGEFLSEAHEATLARVAVLGTTAARELFGDDDPVGQSIELEGQRFQVIGVMRSRGTSPFGMDMDGRVFVPLSTAMRRLYNTDYYSMIRMRVEPGVDMPRVVAQVTALLRERHHIGAGDTDDFGVRSPMFFRSMAARMSRTLTILLVVITLVALGAGALVLANILAVAVSERRVEIGVRRAVGASRAQITQQFLAEGIVVTLIGGAVGLALGVAAALALRLGTELPIALGWEPFVLGPAVSVVVGLVASFVPARRAASTNVASALRP
jgi:putative ABC transport system permease protein